MKILGKKAIHTQIAQERKNLIDEGIALARKVDVLREKYQDIQTKFDTFVAEMHNSLDTAIAEKRKILAELESELDYKLKK